MGRTYLLSTGTTSGKRACLEVGGLAVRKRPSHKPLHRWLLACSVAFAAWGLPATIFAESCTTQSQMQPTQRDALAAAAQRLATQIQNGDSVAVRTDTIPQFQSDFSGLAGLIAGTAPHLKAGPLEVEQVYLLDASKLSKTAAGANPDAQFFCTPAGTQNEVSFQIPQLPPGLYGFASLKVANASPWRVSMLLEQQNGRWLLAGLYPKALMAGGHDGLWYWREARQMSAGKPSWNAWLTYQEARSLLLPAGFITSTHLEKLDTELTASAPPAVAGISNDQPLVLKGADGTEYRFTSITAEDELGQVDVAAHIKVEALGDAVAARHRNDGAAAALVNSHPELRKAFHGVEILTDVQGQGQTPYATEQPMAEIP